MAGENAGGRLHKPSPEQKPILTGFVGDAPMLSTEKMAVGSIREQQESMFATIEVECSASGRKATGRETGKVYPQFL